MNPNKILPRARLKMKAKGRKELLEVYSGQGTWHRLYARTRSRFFPAGELVPYLPRSGKIVNIGCGYGLFTNWFSLLLPKAEFIDIDLQRDHIAVAPTEAWEGVARFNVIGEKCPGFIDGI